MTKSNIVLTKTEINRIALAIAETVAQTLPEAVAQAIGKQDNSNGLYQSSSNNCAYYNLQETADICGMAKKTLYNRLSKNAAKPFPLKPIRTHGRIQFLKSDVQDYVRNPEGKEVK